MPDVGETPPQRPRDKDDALSLLALGSVLLRRRRLIYTCALAGLAGGLALALLPPRVYRSSAVFQPQAAESRAANFAAMASRFGLPTPSGDGEWNAPVYVELLRMRSMLEPLARDTLVVAELGERATAVTDLLGVKAPSQAQRVDRAVRELRRIIRSREINNIGAVEVTATTRWPSVSLALVQRLVHGVDRFNVDTRRSQAAEERAFVALQVQEAKQALQQAEHRLLEFMQSNRAIAGSPELSFEHDRLQREVSQRQQVYTMLIQSLEEARIKEVRDTPVITVLEPPRLAHEPQSRGLMLKAMLGLLSGGVLAALGAFLVFGVSHACRAQDGDALEFLALVKDAAPRFKRAPKR
jgi:hypothetical protein